MSTLFERMTAIARTPVDPARPFSAAEISECGTWRTTLQRDWDPSRPVLVVCMLNPSDADALRNDPTVTTLIFFAQLWGYGGLHIVNLYSFRASKPEVMWAAGDRQIGPGNAAAIEEAFAIATANGGRLLVAWGTEGNRDGRADWFASRAFHEGIEPVCLGRSRDGSPKHPMARGKHRISRDQKPIVWRAA